MRISPDFKRSARTFGIGAGCGFVAGAMLVGVLVWKYGSSAPVQSRRAPMAVDGATAGGSVDGLADVDTPVLEPLRTARGAAVPTSGAGAPPAPDGVVGPPAAPEATLAPMPPADLTARHLEVPVEGIKRDQLVRTFEQQRSGGARLHEAIDILAPRNAPVKAVEDGTVARLFLSKAGGITVYQFDPSEAYCYYYAHLERYADGLKEGDHIKKGQILGYVGTSGNAPKDTPHLHFAVFRLTDAKRWWEGTPIDPYDVLR